MTPVSIACFASTSWGRIWQQRLESWTHGWRVLERGFDQQIDDDMRAFVYLPFEHSEDIVDQELSVRLFDALGGAFQPYAATHRDIIVRFGRFPHRNGELGRETTPAERAFLDEGGFAG